MGTTAASLTALFVAPATPTKTILPSRATSKKIVAPRRAPVMNMVDDKSRQAEFEKLKIK